MLDGLAIAQKAIHKTDLLLATMHVVRTWEVVSHGMTGKQQMLVEAKGYVCIYVFEQLLELWLDLLFVEQLLDLLLG